jgi:proteasome lid subunit RPN8/RPN11
MSPRPAKNQEPDDPELEIEITSCQETEPPGEDPAQRQGQTLLPLGKPTHNPRFLLTYPCLKQVLAHGQRYEDMEIGGVLLGRIWRCERGRVTEMSEAVPAMKTEAGLGHVTFSHETWEEIYNVLATRPPELKIVGWYHSHPGFGVFFSEQDRFIQRNFFAGEGQLGIVVDPQRLAIAAYECREGEVVELHGLLLTAADEARGAAQTMLHKLTFCPAQEDRKGVLQRLAEPIRRRLINDK